MANTLAAFGFKPARHLTGGIAGQLNTYEIAPGYATDIMSGDAVKVTGAGSIAKMTVAADVMLGIFNGVKYVAPDGSIIYKRAWIAGTATKPGTKIEALVYDDPHVAFRVQTSQTISAANQLKFVDIVNGPGNAMTGQSAQSVGNPGGAASQFAVLRVVSDEDGQYAIVEVRPVKHTLLGAAAGVAA